MPREPLALTDHGPADQIAFVLPESRECKGPRQSPPLDDVRHWSSPVQSDVGCFRSASVSECSLRAEFGTPSAVSTPQSAERVW